MINAIDPIEGIAIIGLAGRFPGASVIEQFWLNLCNGIESISKFSDEELLAQGIPPSVFNDPNYVKAGTVMDDIEMFDADFFGFNHREAALIDPQQRFFLETAWEALENAGYDSESYPGLIGVYAGVSMNTYRDILNSDAERINPAEKYQRMLGNEKDFLASRVSYKLNLKGPSFVVQTACSTSLVAVHLACQSLLSYQSDMALAGGVRLILPQKRGYFYQEEMIFSPDGHCRAFDAKAKGIVPGQGVGIVVLKRLSEALADGDTIHAVIKGSAINNDGGLKVGYTAPSIDGQAEVIAAALALGQIDPETITYIEAHGTGTQLGDPIEVAALKQVFQASTRKKGFCAIGSLKTNMGHLDVAAGIAGLIKTVLSIKHRQIVPSLNFEKPNSKIDFQNSPFYVNTELRQWKVNGFPRRAGVSSFGMGGTNAHVVLEEAPAVESYGPSRLWQLLLLSAKTETALDIMTQNLAAHLKKYPHINMADAAFTLQVGRKVWPHRRMLICKNSADAVTALDPADPNRVVTALQKPVNRRVVFMFSGQGAQYVNMGLELYRTENIFRNEIDRCAEILKPALEADIRKFLYPEEDKIEEVSQMLSQTGITQPVLFTLEYALARLWMRWGVQPAAMVGHSIGEYVAACLAEVFSLEDALKLVAARGRLMQQQPEGSMLAVSLSEKGIQSYLDKNISLAAINGVSLCVVSGGDEAIGELEKKLFKNKITCRQLHTSHAFHSPMMAPIVEEFSEQVKQVRLSVPQIRFISNVTGTWITATEATDPGYWARHLRQTVRFNAGLGELMQETNLIFLEIGPGNTLSTFARQNAAKATEQEVVSSLRHPKEKKSDVAFILNTLGRLWLSGIDVNWSGFYAQEKRLRLPLPTYPFERQRYWMATQKQAEDVQLSSESELMTPVSLPQYKNDIADWFYVTSWKRSIVPFQLNESSQSSSWLVFIDECGLGVRLVERLEQKGKHVITVEVSEKFAKLSDCQYVLNPQQDHNYVALLDDLMALNKLPETIVHLWNVTQDDEGQSGSRLTRLDEAQNLGLYSLLAIARALGKQDVSDEYRIEVVSNNIHEVTGEEQLCPEKATLLGPCKVIPLEYSNIKCRSIDVFLPDPSSEKADKLAVQLLTEFNSKPSDTIVAYRGNYRWIPTYEPVRMNDGKPIASRLKQGGVYLIIGGLGGIGLELAEYLATAFQAKLILTGQSAFPARADWEHWLNTHDEDDGISRKIKRLLSIETTGGEILVIRADVADYEKMQDVIVNASEHFNQINGVIHAAGVIDQAGVIQRRSRESTEMSIRSKVRGTLVIDKALKEVELDFILLCSSDASILFHNRFGQVSYVSANGFLDSFAHYKCTTDGVYTVSINWADWQGIGMSADAQKQFIESFGNDARLGDSLDKFSPSEGIAVFRRIISNSFPQVVISTRDFRIRVKNDIHVSSPFLEAASNANFTKQGQHPRPDLSNDFVAPVNQSEITIAEIWQELLGIEKVGILDDYFELGGDSLRATQFISRLRETFQVEMSLQSLFETPTIKEMADKIETLLWARQTGRESGEPPSGSATVEGEI